MTFQQDAQRFSQAITQSQECRNLRIGNDISRQANENLFSGDPRMYGLISAGLAKGYCPSALSHQLGIDYNEVQNVLFEAGVRELRLPLFNASDVRQHNLEANLKILPKERINIMMGTTPSGEIHIANMYSLAGGALVARDVCHKLNKIPLFTLGFNDSLVEKTQIPHLDGRLKIIESFVRKMDEIYSIPIEIIPFSKLQREKEFRTTLSELQRNHVLPTLERSRQTEHQYTNIGTNNVDFADLNWNYRSDLLGLIGLRAYHGNVDVYILGGDHNHSGRVFDVFSRMRKTPPQLISMGVLFGLNGQEMHVSNGNGLFLSEMNPNWIDLLGNLGNTPSNILGPLDYFQAIPKSKQWNMYGVNLSQYQK